MSTGRTARIEANAEGRNFVVGDVHGELHTLKVVLKLLGIDWSAWETPSTEDLEVWTHSGEWCRDKSH